MVLVVLLLGTAARADDYAGKGSVGASLGAMRYTGNQDLSDGAGVRPILRVSFKYTWQNRLVSVLEGGYGWNAYGEGGDFAGPDSIGTLAVVVPFTVGLDYRLTPESQKFMPRVGAGVGVYTVSIRSGRDRISRDRLTDADRRSTGPGFYAKLGSDYALNPSLLVNTDLLWHYALVKDEEKFPTGFLNGNASFAEFRIGLNYYFAINTTGPSPNTPEGGEGE
jgi:opacity protein-like surface antigen